MEQNISLPNHIAIILDGNGRWAKKRGLPRNLGHKKGVETLVKIVRYCSEIGIKNLTVYAFSTENWNRPKEEVDKIFSLLAKFLNKYSKELIKHKARLLVSGDITALPQDLIEPIKKVIDLTKDFKNGNYTSNKPNN